ncbi:integrase, catalytic region, zinc finger, CCHC-type containing protein [Tanacetum coccineum]
MNLPKSNSRTYLLILNKFIDDHDNTIPYHQHQLNNEVESVPTDVSSVVPCEISVITILDDLRLQLEGHIKTNKEQSFANDSLKADLERYKTQILYIPPLRVYDSEETLVQAEVSRTKMLEMMKDLLCKGSSKPINYANLNSLYDTFVPKTQLSREQVYWLPANEVASYNCNQSKPVTNFVRTRPAKSQVYTQLKMLKACFPEFDKVVKDRTTPSYITNGEWHFEHTKKCFVEEIIPFYEKLKTHVKGIEDNLFKEVSEYMKIFDELDKEYDQCVIDKKSLEIENKNLLIQNECLLAESVSKDICSVVLTSDIAVPMSVEPRSNCVKEHSRNLELEAEILKMKQLLVEKEKRCSFIETKYQELELKFQKYKECFENPQVCNNSSSPELNVFFEINKLKDQIQRKDELIRKLKAQISNMKEVSVDSNPKSNSNVSSRAAVPEKPKVLVAGLYAMTPKYAPPQKRNNREANTPLPRKETVSLVKQTNVITKPEVVPLVKSGSVSTSEPANNVIVTPRFSKKPLTSYKRKYRKLKDISTGSPPNTEIKVVNDPVNVVQIVLWYLDSGCSRHMIGDRSKLINYVEKFIGKIRFGNDQFAVIVGYGDYKIGDTIITRVYYVEGLSHNLFLVGQFCDVGLEVAFRKYTCYIRNKDKVDLLNGSRTTNLYSISLKDMMEASPVCLLSKASSTKSWLWHRRLNHLNFGTLNELARKDLVRGLPKLKYEKEHLCPSCQLGKSKKPSHPLKTVNTNT